MDKKTDREWFFYLLLKELMSTYDLDEEQANSLIKNSRLPEWTVSDDMKEYVYHYDVADWAQRIMEKNMENC